MVLLKGLPAFRICGIRMVKYITGERDRPVSFPGYFLYKLGDAADTDVDL